MTTLRSLRFLLRTACALAIAGVSVRAQTMTRLSVDRHWHPGNATSCASYDTTMPMSGDGRYRAFDSIASNLLLVDTNNSSDVFVQERATGKLVRVSVSSSGAEGNSWSVDPAISSTGRYVVFRSAASNLVSGDTNGSEDVFRHDRDPDGDGVFDGGNGVTTRISVDSAGNQTTGICGAPTISSDGSKVVFVSDATNLVTRDTNGAPDAFVRDVAAGTTTRVSVGYGGLQANYGCLHADLSPDGTIVAFSSDSTNLVKWTDTNGVRDVFTRNLVGEFVNTIRVSFSSSGAQANGNCNINPHCLSNDGNVVVFWSDATNLVAGDTNGVRDVFVRNRSAKTTVIASMDSFGILSDGESNRATIDATGDRVAFSSLASNLVSGSIDPTPDWDVFIRYVSSAETELVSNGTSYWFADGDSSGSTISPDGNFVQFGSNASDLVDPDTNGSVRDVFSWDLYSLTNRITFVSALPPGGAGNGNSWATSVSKDQRYVVFESLASNLVPFDRNGKQDIFVYSREDGRIVRVSVNSAGQEGNGDSTQGTLSPSGRFVAFTSVASNLSGEGADPVTTPGRWHIYLHDRDPDGNGVFDEANGKTKLISDVYNIEANGPSGDAKLSADGDWIAFSSRASNLIGGDTNGKNDVFFQGLDQGWYQQSNNPASVSSAGVLGNEDSYCQAISADGSRIAFISLATNLVPPLLAGWNLFVRDRVTGVTSFVADSVLQGNDQRYLWLLRSSFSGDGTKVVFQSVSTTVVSPDANGEAYDIIVYDSTQGSFTRVNVSDTGVQSNDSCNEPHIGASGRYVAFASGSTNLVPGWSGSYAYANLYLCDLVAGTIRFVNVTIGGNASGYDGDSYWPIVSDEDELFVVYSSESPDLVTDDWNTIMDVFLYQP